MVGRLAAVPYLTGLDVAGSAPRSCRQYAGGALAHLRRKGRREREAFEAVLDAIPMKGHAISAKRLSHKQRKDGNLSKDKFERINRKADKVLKSKSDD